jgi:DNA-binding GntR family transcriptional regulator
MRTLRVRSTGARNDVVELTATAATAGRRFSATVAEERLTLVPAPADIAERLALPDTACVLKLERTLRTAGGAPVEVRTAYCRISLVGGGFTPRLRSRLLQ